MVDIRTKIEFWKSRLLDLSGRNRLINCQLPQKGRRISRSNLLISKPEYNALWMQLSEGEQTFEFPIPLIEGEVDGLLTEPLLDKTYTGIVTNQTPYETYKTLRSIMRKAKEFQEEKGLNALYLAFGFLNWRENGKDAMEMRSPLVLMPVKLTQEDLFSPFLLSHLDEETTTNYSLEQKLLNDFGIELPHLTDDNNIDDYLQQVRQAVSALGWSVETSVTQLSLFSFMKINMYRDLERNSDKIAGHHIVRFINGEVINDASDLSFISGYKHDNSDPKEVFSVVDADSSQQDAILLAKRGISFILQGPPGTGKSQTITNIIAELIAEGKKVLFVSEKMAALEVVYKRLSQAGLADFCLTLHSHNAKRREILNQFDRSMKISRQRVDLQQDAYSRLYRLKETRNALNQYCTELHTVIDPLGKTIYQVNGLIAQLEDYPDIDYVQIAVEKFTPELLVQSEIALEEITRVVEKSGYQQKNPWNGCVLVSSPTYEFRQRFSVDSKVLISQIEEGLIFLQKMNQIIDNSNLEWSWSSLCSIKKVYDLIMISPEFNVEWLEQDLQLAIKNLEAIVQDILNYQALKENLFMLREANIFINDAVQREIPIQYGQILEQAISSNLDAYNNDLESWQLLRTEKENLTILVEEAKEKLLYQEQVNRTECMKKNELESDWEKASNQVCEQFIESIMTLDAVDMLSRFQRDYKSWLRMFNSSYRKDRKKLQGYRKSSNKITYEEGVSILESIITAKNAKAAYERQNEIAKYAKRTLDQARENNDSTLEKQVATTSSLSFSESKFIETKTLLVQSLNNEIAKQEQLLAQKKQELFNTQHSRMLKDVLGIAITFETDFESLRKCIEWCIKFQKLVIEYHFGKRFIAEVCNAQEEFLSNMTDNVTKIISWRERTSSNLDRFVNLFSDQDKQRFYSLTFRDLLVQIESCRDNFSSLESLIDYRIASDRLDELNIGEYLSKAKDLNLAAEKIVPVFRKCFFRSWLDTIIPHFSAISEFRRLRQDERIALFRSLDKLSLGISRGMLTSKLISRLPNIDVVGSNNELALLRREMAKQRKLMPTRRLISALPSLLPALKPCIMMSPLSVSTYLGDSTYEFDTVIFDEASQVRTEDAIGAIYRARQAIIAGDSKQLPPTDFFMSSISNSDDFEEDENEEVIDIGAFESLLDEATLLPTLTLLWHYRSRHENLIAFSNSKIYQGNLITFPSSIVKTEGMGVEFIHVSGGTYERSSRNGNRKEAARVADLVFDHFKQFPKRSLGVIAFGEIQQNAILDAILERRKKDPSFENFFNEEVEEPVFIKNLETVQGDERDTIIFSIGYAPDATGRFIMNFGPLSRNGGERRLNVAITRARYNLKLIGSILPTDIDTERTSGIGPKLLRSYIDYAINGALAILGEVSTNNEPFFDSPFETAIYQFLIENGYDVSTQVGCSGYRIDLAVLHPKFKGRFAIGIECDGAMYHSARTSRERDRLRQTVLEDMGWTIHRVWSTDWIKDRHSEGKRLLSKVKEAIDNYRETKPLLTKKANESVDDFLKVTIVSADQNNREGVKQRIKTQRSPYYGCQAKDIPARDFVETMMKVLKNSFGLDKLGLFKEVAYYGYGWERQGQTIKIKLEQAFEALLLRKNITVEDSGKIKLVESRQIDQFAKN